LKSNRIAGAGKFFEVPGVEPVFPEKGFARVRFVFSTQAAKSNARFRSAARIEIFDAMVKQSITPKTVQGDSRLRPSWQCDRNARAGGRFQRAVREPCSAFPAKQKAVTRSRLFDQLNRVSSSTAQD